ncbi:MAG TPA: GTPase domain-containing protein [Tepidisphaeraceae bacterium]
MDPSDLQLIREVADLTGGSPPEWTDSSAPTLQTRNDDSLYYIGVIGGKDVGKSSLVNALLGRPLAGVSAHGEGTRRALAYAHRDAAAAVRTLLQSQVPDQFDVITHTIDEARGRVLLDLPDVDSVWAGHLDLTRSLLRHMLFPVWVQSVEKYADAQPLQLLAKVAAGNSPENFLFVLTKADLLAARHGAAAVDELKADYAERVARACGLEKPPRVFAVDGRGTSNGFDLDALRETALAVRSEKNIAGARQLARQQQSKTMHQWLMQQRVDDRLAAAQRLLNEAEALIAHRVTEPLVDRVTIGLAADGAARGGLVEPAVRSRLSYWPIVNVIDAVLGPVVSAFRGRGQPLTSAPSGDTDAARRIRGVFAELAQRDPQLLSLYAQNKLWENDPADRAAGTLELQLEAAVESHRRTLLTTAGRPSILIRLIAPIITLGAALWFPIVQPALDLYLSGTVTEFTRQSVVLIVRLLGAEYLIRSVGMLAIYFIALWMLLRWFAYRKVDRALRQSTDATHPAAAVVAWSARLLDPLRQHVAKLQALSDRIAAVATGRAAA